MRYLILLLLISCSLFGQRSGTVMTSYNNSSAVTSTTVTENSLPSIQITSPSDGDTLTIDTSFTASVTATDSDGTIDSVVFFINDVRQAVDVSSPYTYNLPTGSVINRELKAIAYDNSLGSASDSLIYYIEVEEVIYDEAIINFTNFNSDNAPSPVNNANDGSETGDIYPDVISDTWEYTSGDVMNEKLEIIYSPSKNNYATAPGKSINGFSGAITLRQWKVQVDSLHLRVTGLEPNTDYFFRIFASHGSFQGNNAEYRLNDQVLTLNDMVDKDEPIEDTVTSDANGYIDIITRIAAGNPQGLIGGISFRKTGEYFLQPPTISNDFSAVEGRNVAIYENTINQKLFTLTGGTAPYTIRKDTLDGRWAYLDSNVMYNQNILDYESMYASHSVGGPMRILVNDSVGGEALFLVDALDATGIWDDNGVVGVSEADSLNSMLGFEKFKPGDYHALQSTNTDPDLELTPSALCDSCNIYLSGAWKNVILNFTNNDRDSGNKMMVSNGIGQLSFYENFVIRGPRNVRISGAYDSINKLGDPNFNGEVWHEWKHQKFGIYRDIGQLGPGSGNNYGFQFRVLGYNNNSNHHITTRAWKDVEIDHFEAIGGGAASIELKDDNIDSVFNVSGTYLHDFITQWPKGEGGYYGNTKPVWQEMTQNLVVKNAMYLQAGNEALQISKNTGTMLLSNLIASGAMNRYNTFQKFQDGIVNFGPAEPQGFQTITKSVFLGPGGLGSGILMKPSSNLVQDAIDAGTIDTAATYTATANDTMQFTYNVFNKFAKGNFYMNNDNNSDTTWAIVKFQDNYWPNEWNHNPDHLEEIQLNIVKDPNAVNFVDIWDMPIVFDRNNVPSFWTASVDGNSANDVIETNTTNQNSSKLHFNNPYGVDDLLPSVKTKIINAVGSVASLHVDSLHRHAQFTNAIFADVQNKENFIISNPDYRVDSLRVYKPHDVIIDFIPDISRKDGEAKRQMMFYCIQEFKDSTDRPWKHPEAFVPLRWVNNEGSITHSPPNDYTLSDTSFYAQFDIGIINTSD